MFNRFKSGSGNLFIRAFPALVGIAFLVTVGGAWGQGPRQGILHYWDAYEPYADTSNPWIGVEVEGRVQSSIGRAGLALNLAEELVRQGFTDAVDYEYLNSNGSLGYVVDFVVDSNDVRWKVTEDLSILTTQSEVTAELVTPILKTPRDFQVFESVLKSLAKGSGFLAEPTSAGIHVHVNFPNARTAEVLVLTRLFMALEASLVETFSVSKQRLKGYILPVAQLPLRVQIDEQSIDSSNTIDETFLRRYFKSREKTLNFFSLLLHGTAEFRIFNSTLEYGEIELMVEFASALVKAVRTKDTALSPILEKIAEDPSIKIKVDEMAKALNLSKISNGVGLNQIRSAAQVASTRDYQQHLHDAYGAPMLAQSLENLRRSRRFASQSAPSVVDLLVGDQGDEETMHPEGRRPVSRRAAISTWVVGRCLSLLRRI